MNDLLQGGPPAIGVSVTRNGEICEVIYLGIPGLAEPQSFADLLGPVGRSKSHEFLETAFREGVAVDWEIPVESANGPILCRFSGVRRDDTLVVLGWSSSTDFYDLYDELIRINNEQANALRESFKTLARCSTRGPQNDDTQFDELTNELSVVQRDLAKKNQELKRINQHKDELLGTVSHDLRNPIAAIAGFVKLILHADAKNLSPASQNMLNRTLGASEFMLGLVNDLLDYSAIETGHIRLDDADHDLTEVLTDVLEMTRPAADLKEMPLESELLTGVQVRLDARKVQQVVANLITNAIKYSPRGSTVWLRSMRIDDGVRFEVQDDGPGIPRDEREALFRPFGTTSVRGTEGEKSTGLGLAIAKRVMEALGGQIGVTSEVDQGSTFWCHIPTARVLS